MQTVKTTVIILICLTLLGACGLKGPLYIPDENPALEQDTLPDEDVKKEEENEGSEENQSTVP